MLEAGAAMPSGYPNSICDAAVWMRHNTEFVADGQTALRVQREYMDIYIYTNMPGAAACPCVSSETRD